jgi:VWFA-related protein
VNNQVLEGSAMLLRSFVAIVLAVVAMTGVAPSVALRAQQPQEPQQGEDRKSFRFRTGVELINVNATVTDASGRFVSGLRKEDFRLFEDDRPQEITHFNSERVPVSLGIALDTSGSMTGEKMLAARDALERFFQLLGPDDEVFLYRFDSNAELVHGWTMDRTRIRTALGRMYPRGGTAMYDAVAEAVPLTLTGRHKKKALLVISDGNDTSSRTDVRSLKQMIRESEVLVYAVGIDSESQYTNYGGRQPGGVTVPPRQPPRLPIPLPFPMPRRRPPGGNQVGFMTSPQQRYGRVPDERVNVAALRDLTDDSGGRTEIVRSARDLDPATSSIADELSKQYYIGYPAAAGKDGRWHTIRVEVKNGYRVRARRGYTASTS